MPQLKVPNYLRRFQTVATGPLHNKDNPTLTPHDTLRNITTNRALWDDLTDAKSEPIKRRIIEYILFKPITSDYKPIICFHTWKSFCNLSINKAL